MTGVRLSGIQGLRGIAASAVVLSHAARHVDKALGAPALITLFQAGHAGVDLFFVISGFIILFVHRGDVGRPIRLAHYAGRRFNRVLPLYWMALLLTVGIGFAGSHALPAPVTFAWSALLLPSVREPLLGIAWTLQFEVVFYVVFAVLILSRTAGIVLMAAWLAWIAARALGYGDAAVPPSLSGLYCLEFFLGMGVAHLVRGPVPLPRLLAAAGAILFLLAMALESAGWFDGTGRAARLAYGIPAAMLVLGVAAAERDGRLTAPAWLEALGSASYSIYLFQFVFIGIAWQAWLHLGLAPALPAAACFAVLAFAGIAGGVVMSRLVEQPLLSLMRGRRQPAPLRA